LNNQFNQKHISFDANTRHTMTETRLSVYSCCRQWQRVCF